MSFYKNKRVLVTGGAGFIGSYLVELLVADEAKVTVADNLCRGTLKRIASVKNKIKLLELDLSDYRNCLLACKEQEIVMNLAAKVTGIEYNRTHQAEMFISNMNLQQNVIKAAAERGVKRFLQVSTACIYPHDAKVPTPESEGDRGSPEPTNLGYGWAKRMGEQLAQFYAKDSSMKVTIVRPFNSYGLRDHFDEATSHVIPALIKRVLDGENPVVVWGTGNQSRVFIHAKDVAKAMRIVAERYANVDAVNIGHDNEITMKNLISLILEITGKDVKVVFDTSKPDGYPRRAADTTKLKRITEGWVPDTPLEEGIKEMVEQFKTHRSP
ncbi:MAG: NAD-dependent epimerase/dehydratase family protein [Candidatus Omnitrophota bacterium]|nr:MAG: NAD-dependent epimerase/dehydratase family protein [Candidatus Omnitrophota bacterium]